MSTWTSPQSSSALMTYRWSGWRILQESQAPGLLGRERPDARQLPLTLILDKDGTVLFCHHGARPDRRSHRL